jgi:hypothetical protein
MSELARHLTWPQTPAALYHYHDRGGHEVDAVLEDYAGRVIGIEVKSAQSVRSEDLLGLRCLKEKLGSRMLAQPSDLIRRCSAARQELLDGPFVAVWVGEEHEPAPRQFLDLADLRAALD